MKIKEEFPPNYSEIRSFLGDLAFAKPIFTYGDVIYNPYKRELTPDIIQHESIHENQQGNDPYNWWMRYLNDRSFRFNQEVIAYGEQFKFAKEKGVNGKMLEWLKEKLALELSGEAYGKLCTYGEAVSKIRKFS